MTKKTKLTGKCLFDIVVSKSKKALEGIKIPFQKRNLKTQFKSQVTEWASAFIELKTKAIGLLMDVKNIDIDALLDIQKDMKNLYEEMQWIAKIYENIFGEKLELDLSDEDLNISSADVLSQAVEVDEDED